MLFEGLANFVDNNCWFLFGTRLKSERLITKPFTDNAGDPKWFKIVSSDDDEMDVDTKSDKENKFDRKKIKLVVDGKSSDAGKRKTETDSDDDGNEDFTLARCESSESITETSCWRVFPSSLSVYFSDDVGAGESVRKRFVLKKQNKK